ncbi:MAG: NAD(P)-dependent oxidoreductase [Deltaproteobacteria bacterium]|nr:NAD(P)-dependent oxidoreductase [Deltaproteobacteria bacterium]MBW2299839.1 NAD(P)-dependent oxidoreductase [Deltaproteobacteria bacterium]
MKQKVGIIGLGIMGSAMSANLLKAGFQVTGYDIVPERVKALVEKNGVAATSCKEVAQKTDVVITSLPSNEALHEVVLGKDSLSEEGKSGLVVVETSTLTLEAKNEAYEALKRAGVEMLDCPLSGTGAQAARRDIVVYASGTRKVCEDCGSVFDGIARANYYVGEFGMGTKMKFVANLLVTVHNASAAEAFVLGMKAGLDPELIYKVISDSAGSSRMFEVRGPLMVNASYDEPTMKVELHQKDIKIISAFAKELHCPTPLLSTSAQLYTSALAHGWAKRDTASLCAVMEKMAGFERKKDGTR